MLQIRRGPRRSSSLRRGRGVGCSRGAARPPTSAAPVDGPPGRRAAPALADVTPLSDARDWDGPPPRRSPTPRSTRSPTTPSRAAGHRHRRQGTEVTVTDTSRILALDVYGTLARTVFELGLGDRLVGRDISTQFDEAADLPLVTQNGHDLNAEAILDLDPTVILTDTSLGPWDVVLQMRDSGIPVVVVDSHRGLDNVAELTHAGRRPARRARTPATRWPSAPSSRSTTSPPEIAAVAPADAAAGCAPSSSTCAASPASTTCSARAPAPTR